MIIMNDLGPMQFLVNCALLTEPEAYLPLKTIADVAPIIPKNGV